jgi:hypothetical protein
MNSIPPVEPLYERALWWFMICAAFVGLVYGMHQ